MADSQQQQQQLVAAASSSQSNNDPLVTAAVDDGPQQLSFSAAASSGGGSADPAQQQQPKDKNSRWIRIVVASIKAVLFLELAGMVAGPWIASKTSRRRRRSSDTGSDSDLDPADVLMDYLTGKTSAQLACMSSYATVSAFAAVIFKVQSRCWAPVMRRFPCCQHMRASTVRYLPNLSSSQLAGLRLLLYVQTLSSLRAAVLLTCCAASCACALRPGSAAAAAQ
jgi:hypothetical protein